MIEQLLIDGDIVAAQVLGMGATHYAGTLITASVGKPLPGSNVLEALVHARQSFSDRVHLPAPVTDALRDLQIVAVLFAMQLATSDDACASESLRQIEDKLVAALKQDTARVDEHDRAMAARVLSDRALDYMHQVIFAEDNGMPIGSSAMQRALTEFQIAAVVFTTQLTTAEGYDPTLLRRVEGKLVAALTDHGGS